MEFFQVFLAVFVFLSLSISQTKAQRNSPKEADFSSFFLPEYSIAYEFSTHSVFFEPNEASQSFFYPIHFSANSSLFKITPNSREGLHENYEINFDLVEFGSMALDKVSQAGYTATLEVFNNGSFLLNRCAKTSSLLVFDEAQKFHNLSPFDFLGEEFEEYFKRKSYVLFNDSPVKKEKVKLHCKGLFFNGELFEREGKGGLVKEVNERIQSLTFAMLRNHLYIERPVSSFDLRGDYIVKFMFGNERKLISFVFTKKLNNLNHVFIRNPKEKDQLFMQIHHRIDDTTDLVHFEGALDKSLRQFRFKTGQMKKSNDHLLKFQMEKQLNERGLHPSVSYNLTLLVHKDSLVKDYQSKQCYFFITELLDVNTYVDIPSISNQDLVVFVNLQSLLNGKIGGRVSSSS